MEISRTENAPAIVEAEGGAFTGVVRNLRRGESPGGQSNEPSDREEFISFRLELSDTNGDITGYVPVEMRGRRILGDVAENDRVSVNGRRNLQGIVTPSSFTNLTTGSRVYTNEQYDPRFLMIVLAILVLAGLFFAFFEN